MKFSIILKVNDFQIAQHILLDHFSHELPQMELPQFLMLVLHLLTDPFDKKFRVVAVRVRNVVLKQIVV